MKYICLKIDVAFAHVALGDNFLWFCQSFKQEKRKEIIKE